jgi:hypothetical protein
MRTNFWRAALSIAFLLYFGWILRGYSVLVMPHQAFWDSLLRFGSAFLSTVALVLCAYGLGSRISKRLLADVDNLLEEALFSIALGALALSHIVLLLGLVGLLYQPVAFILVGMGLLLGARDIVSFLSRIAGRLQCVQASPMSLLIGAVLLSLLVVGLQPALLPPTSYDILWYHYGLPTMYLQAHEIFPTPDQQISGYPLGAEMLYMLSMLLESEITANLVNYLFGLGACLASIALARRLRVRPALLAAMVFLGTPLVVAHLSEAYVELAQAFYVTLALLALLKALARMRESGPAERRRGLLVISALLLGGAMSIKYNSNVIFALMVIGMAVSLGGHRQWGARNVILLTAMYAGIALAVVMPWYIKNLLHYSHPLYPVFVRSGDGALQSLLSADHNHGIKALLSAAWDSTMRPAQHFSRSAIGPLFLMLIPAGLLLDLAEPAISDSDPSGTGNPRRLSGWATNEH